MKKIIFRAFKITFIFIVTVSLILGSYLYYFLNKSKPIIDGEIAISSLESDVIVTRDYNGVPTIIAKSDKDLYKAQGFIQAQDRLFQMDMARRQASGTLSEVVGKAALDNDKKFLTYSLRKAAEKSYNEAYSSHAKEVLNYFAEGVNSYINYAKENNSLPYEFILLGYEPNEWTPIDTVTISKYMAYDLGGHWDTQAFNNWILNNLGEEKLRDVLPESHTRDVDFAEILKANKEAGLLIDNKVSSIERPPHDNGSNNWVISGKRTKSGKTLIADDPHLSLSTPSIWYQMILKSDNINVSGVIFTGVPGIILGNNNDMAWTVTNVGPDVQDLYIEKFHPEDRKKYYYDNEWREAEIVTHNIKVKGDNSVPFEVVYTHHGPVIDELIKPLNGDNNLKYSMRWTALEATTELDAILKLNKAKNISEFEEGLLKFNAPAQNFIYADNEGNILFKANGNIPIRKKGMANLPVPGYSSEYEWIGYIDYSELPKIVNPEEGYIATANTNTIGDSYKYHLSNVWAQPYRMSRIKEVLDSSKNDFTVEDMKKLQMDTKNLYAQDFLPKMLSFLNNSDIDKEVYNILAKWDFDDNKHSAAPLIFDRWIKNIRSKIFLSNMNEDEYKFMPNKEGYTDRLLNREFRGDKSFIISELGGLEKVLKESLDKAILDIEREQGKNKSAWNWGQAHRLSFKHPLSISSDILDKLLNPDEIPVSGSRVTVQAASVKKDDNLVNHGASWRYIYDFSDRKSYHIVGPGQSGHILSDYYSNQVKNWVNGIYSSNSLEDNNYKHKLILKGK